MSQPVILSLLSHSCHKEKGKHWTRLSHTLVESLISAPHSWHVCVFVTAKRLILMEMNGKRESVGGQVGVEKWNALAEFLIELLAGVVDELANTWE